MIRILIADLLPARTIDQLNEIPEFEIIDRSAAPAGHSMAIEISDVDAVIAPAATLWPPAVLENAANLKIVILTGAGPDALDRQMPGQKNVTIRRVHGSATHAPEDTSKQGERRESEVIAILKDFFNV
jgi:phosphoglycerate dehydrogenase-like enzyme